MDGNNIPSSKLRTMVINVTNNNPSGSCVGVLATGTVANASNVTSADTIRGSTVNVNTSGQEGGYASCIRVAGSNRTSARDTNMFVTGTNCSNAQLIACETFAASSYLDLRASVISASGSSMVNCSLAEISQTGSGSEIILSYTRLQNHGANGLGFTPAQIPTNLVFGLFDTNNWTAGEFNDEYYLLPGTTSRANAITTTTGAAPFIIEQDCILRGVYLSANASLGAAVLTLNIYHSNTQPSNNIFSLSLTGSTSRTSNNTKSYMFHESDSMYVSLCGENVAPNTDVRSFQVNVGLF
jgi:hypothetical protein